MTLGASRRQQLGEIGLQREARGEDDAGRGDRDAERQHERSVAQRQLRQRSRDDVRAIAGLVHIAATVGFVGVVDGAPALRERCDVLLADLRDEVIPTELAHALVIRSAHLAAQLGRSSKGCDLAHEAGRVSRRDEARTEPGPSPTAKR